MYDWWFSDMMLVQSRRMRTSTGCSSSWRTVILAFEASRDPPPSHYIASSLLIRLSYSYSILFMVQISPTDTTKIVLLLVPSFEEKKWIWIQLSTRYTDDVWTLSNFRSVLTPNGAVTLKRSVSEIYVPNRLQNVRPLLVPLGHIFDVPKKIPNLHSAYQQETNINWWELKINYNCRCVRNLSLLRASN